jgi:hypothetical protein
MVYGVRPGENAMNRRLQLFVLPVLLAATAALAADPPPEPVPAIGDAAPVTEPASAPVAFEELLVSGEQPGPGLWRVSKPTSDGENVLWILGNYGPLPRRMEWRTTEVERVIARSQEVLGPAAVDADVGVWSRIAVLPSLVGIRDNPDGRTLEQLVPPDLYARWLVLKAEYLGDGRRVERWRPIFAAGELYEEAIKASGLERNSRVWPAVEKIARKHRVPVTRPTIEVPVEKPRAIVKEFKKSGLDDLDCFAKTIERLESDLELMRERANAWAVGDVRTLERLAPVDQFGACLSVVTESELLRSRGLDDLPERLAETWIAAAEEALDRNASTFAVLWMSQVLRPDGLVERLRRKGYAVEAP